MKNNKLFLFLKELLGIYFNNHIDEEAAVLSYYLLFSFFPASMVIYATLAMIKIDITWFDSFFTNLMPEQVSSIIDQLFRHLAEQENITYLIIGVGLTLSTMARYMKSLETKIRNMYQSKPKRNFFAQWGVSLFFSLLVICAFYITLFLLMTGENLFDFIGNYIHISQIFVRLWLFLRFIIIGACVFLVLFLIYCVLPGVRQKIGDIIPGTFFSMISWLVISAIFSYYMDNFARYSVLYGSIGAFIILLLWFYLSNTLLLLGGAINSVRYRAKHHTNNMDEETIKYKKSKILHKEKEGS